MRPLGKTRWIMLAAPVLALCLILGADEKDSPVERPPNEIIIRIYDINDLIHRERDFPYLATSFPGSYSEGGEGGAFTYDDWLAEDDRMGASSREWLEQIVELIRASVDPESWTEMETHLAVMVGALVIRQTPDNHRQIEDILTRLRETLPSLIAVTIQAQWVDLPTEQFVEITSGTDGPLTILPADAVASGQIRYIGQITCRNNQIAHIVSGTVQTELSGLEPLVTDGVASFKPYRRSYLLGAMLQIQPVVSHGQDQVFLDIQSSVTQPLSVEKRPVSSMATSAPAPSPTDLDLPRLLLHNLVATVRVPLNQPVLIGAMTASTEDGPSDTVLCLIVRVTTSAAE